MVFRGQDVWRSHPIFHSMRFDTLLPGFRKAVVVFGIYVAADQLHTRLTRPKSSFDASRLRWTKEPGQMPTLVEEEEHGAHGHH
jgi:hypothetical protein